MKTRAIVWTAVGVVVVVAVIFLMATGRRPPGPDIEGVRHQTEMVAERLAALEQRVADAREQLPAGEDPAILAPVVQLMMDARNALAEVEKTDNLNEAMEKLGEARSSYSSANRQFRRLLRQVRPRR